MLWEMTTPSAAETRSSLKVNRLKLPIQGAIQLQDCNIISHENLFKLPRLMHWRILTASETEDGQNNAWVIKATSIFSRRNDIISEVSTSPLKKSYSTIVLFLRQLTVFRTLSPSFLQIYCSVQQPQSSRQPWHDASSGHLQYSRKPTIRRTLTDRQQLPEG
jgi:hypothetical protein